MGPPSVPPVRLRRVGNRRRGITGLTVSGYKAIHDEISLKIAPLTLISGTNSSGKSSFMQPFLMLKQTLEAQFDPGALLIHGPNVQLTSWLQGMSRGKSRSEASPEFSLKVSLPSSNVQNVYKYTQSEGIDLVETVYTNKDGHSLAIGKSSTPEQLQKGLPPELSEFFQARRIRFSSDASEEDAIKFYPERDRCFLDIVGFSGGGARYLGPLNRTEFNSSDYVRVLRDIIHVPGLRGNPERTYNSAAAGSTYPGTMELYVASVIHKWGSGDDVDKKKLSALADDLRHLGLTWKVKAQRIDDVRLELLVGRMSKPQAGGANDLVSIADVGFGVSQTLPILVALHAAVRGQLVYIEQPETHLHPKAQTRLGDVLVRAASRGVRVVVETHSSLLLRSIQTSVAQGEILPDRVSLNWFSRDDKTGFTKVDTASVDSYGRFGEWPVDFDEIAEEADWRYLNAVQEAVSDESD